MDQLYRVNELHDESRWIWKGKGYSVMIFEDKTAAERIDAFNRQITAKISKKLLEKAARSTCLEPENF